MNSIADFVNVVSWLNHKSQPPRGMLTKVTIGNVHREVVRFEVWVTETLCVTVAIANYDRVGKTVEQIQDLIWERAQDLLAEYQK